MAVREREGLGHGHYIVASTEPRDGGNNVDYVSSRRKASLSL